MVEFLVRRERKLDVKADVAIRRLERLEKEDFQREDEAVEASLPEALPDKTKVVQLLVDKWFVDEGFGFGKVPSGEVVFIHASAVQGAEVLTIGTEAWVQVVSDDARAQGGVPSPQSMGEGRMGARERHGKGEQSGRACQTKRPSSRQSWWRSPKGQCPRCAPILRAFSATNQLQSAASPPTAADSPFLAGGNSLSSGRSFLAPRPRGARARSIARDVDAKSLVDMVVDFYVKGHWRRRSPDAPEARKHEASRGAAMSRAVAKASRGGAALPGQKGGGAGPLQKTRRLERRLREGVQALQVMRSLNHNRKEDEKSLDKWTDELRAKAEAEEIKKDEAGGRPLSKASQRWSLSRGTLQCARHLEGGQR